MNWLHDFLAEDTSSQHKPMSLGRYLLTRTLPVLLTGIFLFWASGGILPTPWRSLITALSQFGVLWQQRGIGMLFALLVLIIQALLICLAWILLGWLLFKEKVVLTTIQSALKHGHFPSLGTTIVTMSPPPPHPSTLIRRQSATTALPDPSLYNNATLVNPFEEKGQRGSPAYQYQSPVPPPPTPTKPQPIPEPEVDYFLADPFDVDEEDQAKLPEELLSDPLNQPEPPPLAEDDPFVHGDPFAGALPEVLLTDDEIKNAPLPQPIKKKRRQEKKDKQKHIDEPGPPSVTERQSQSPATTENEASADLPTVGDTVEVEDTLLHNPFEDEDDQTQKTRAVQVPLARQEHHLREDDLLHTSFEDEDTQKNRVVRAPLAQQEHHLQEDDLLYHPFAHEDPHPQEQETGSPLLAQEHEPFQDNEDLSFSPIQQDDLLHNPFGDEDDLLHNPFAHQEQDDLLYNPFANEDDPLQKEWLADQQREATKKVQPLEQLNAGDSDT